ncbi:MAG: hypothetical protein EA381_17710 [Planctomycetaceae bacterium]|nr:MAG: hypothetical protein EA381_17710 [Planctomycetaceae bacterium]
MAIQFTRTLHRLELDFGEMSRLAESALYLHFPGGPKADHELFLQNSSRWWMEFAPRRLVDTIHRWHIDPDRPGVLMIDGLGIDPDLPPTPTDGRRSPNKLTTYSEQVLVAVAGMLGQPIGFSDERNGDLVADLTPVRGKAAALTNEGAGKLGWHIEHNATGFLLDPPVRVVDYLVFFHLREDPRGEARTLVSDIRDVLPLLSPSVIETLRRPEFVLRPPLQVRGSLPVERREALNVAILTGPSENPHVRAAMYGDLTAGLTDAAQAALVELESVLDATQRQVPTTPGRLVLVDNRRVLHARFPYQPAFDGRDRWLQRVMVTTSLEPLRHWQRDSARILSPGA